MHRLPCGLKTQALVATETDVSRRTCPPTTVVWMVIARARSASPYRPGWYCVPRAPTTSSKSGTDREFCGTQLVVAGGKTRRQPAGNLEPEFGGHLTGDRGYSPHPRQRCCATGTSTRRGATSELQCALHAGEQQRAIPDGGFLCQPANSERIGSGLAGDASGDRACKPTIRAVDQISGQPQRRFVRGTGGDVPGSRQCRAVAQ